MNFLIRLKDAAAFDFEFSIEHDANRFRIDTVFFLQDAGAERLLRVPIFHRDDGLQDDRAGIEIFVHEVDRATGKFYAVFERLALRFQARKRRQQRRVNIQNAVWKRRHKVRRQQAHISGKANQVHLVLVQDGDDLPVVGFTLQTFRWNHARSNAARFGTLDTGRAFAVTDDHGDFRVRNPARGDAVRQRLEI